MNSEVTVVQLNDIPAHVPNVLGREMDGELVLVHPGQGKVRVLNGVGARLWALMDGRRTVSDLAQAIAAEYVVGPAQAASDTLAFCVELQNRGLVELS